MGAKMEETPNAGPLKRPHLLTVLLFYNAAIHHESDCLKETKPSTINPIAWIFLPCCSLAGAQHVADTLLGFVQYAFEIKLALPDVFKVSLKDSPSECLISLNFS